MNTTQNTFQTLTEKETAKIIKRAVQSLRNDRHKRQGLPYVKLGRSVRYLMSDILEYLQKNRIDPKVK